MTRDTFWKYFALWFRMLYGAHLIYSGCRAILTPWQAKIPGPGGEFLHGIEVIGLYGMVKWVELLTGIMLVFNIFVPLALIIEFPITVTIFYLNTFIVGLPRQLFSGPQELVFNSVMFMLYAKYYMPVLTFKAQVSPVHLNWRPGAQSLKD